LRDPRWVSLIKARAEHFPGLLQDPAFRKLAHPRVALRIGRPGNLGPLATLGDQHVPGPQSLLRHSVTGRVSRVGLAHREPVTIACFSKATMPLGGDLDTLIAAMEVYVDEYVAPVWGTPAKLVKTTGFQKGAWAMLFLNDTNQPGAL